VTLALAPVGAAGAVVTDADAVEASPNTLAEPSAWTVKV
jgi:hypothetical protein